MINVTKNEFMNKIKSDFRNLLYVVWRDLGLSEPTNRQYEIADYLQSESSKRRIIEAYRGFGKTWITSVYIIWKLLRNPQEKILVVSASGRHAASITTFVQRLIIELPYLQHLVPPAYMRWSTLAFDVNGKKPDPAPSVKSSGITSQITGDRASVIILDDVETANTAETEVSRDKLFDILNEMEHIIVPEGSITYLGTPHHLDSIYSEQKLLSRGYTAYILPARYPKLDSLAHYKTYLSPKLVKELQDNPELQWKPTDPQRFPEEVLRQKELAVGHSEFMMQYMLDLTSTDDLKYPLRLSDLIVFETDSRKAPVTIRHTSSDGDEEFKLDYTVSTPRGYESLYGPSRVDKEWLEYQGIIMAIDPAGRGADQTAYCIIGQLHGKLYVLDLGGYDGGYDDDVLLDLAKKAKEYNVNQIVIEDNFGDGMFTKIFTPILLKFHQCELESVKQTKQKELRLINTLEPVLNQHRLIVESEVIKREYNLLQSNSKYSLLYQLSYLSGEKGALAHDDKLDALAIGVQAWQEALGLDEHTLYEMYKQEQLEESLDTFYEALGKPKEEADLRYNFLETKGNF